MGFALLNPSYGTMNRARSQADLRVPTAMNIVIEYCVQ
jgi:hypothetical protein